MATARVDPDRWTPLIDDRLRFFLGVDPLLDAGYRPAIEYGIDPDHDPEQGTELLEVRTRASMPAGWRLQFVYQKRLFLPAVEARLRRVDTQEFRAARDDDYPYEGDHR